MMRALVLEGPRNLVLKEIAKPEPDGNKVLIKVTACGICGSDIHHFWQHGEPKGIVLGHEFTGIVVDPGANPNLKVGDRVTVNEFNPCGTCELCKSGNENVCNQIITDSPGISVNGAYTEYVLARPDKVKELPDNISDNEGALIEPLAIGMHANRRAKTGPGSKVLISGGGAIGVFCAVCAKALGASYVAMTEVDSERIKIAQEYPFVDEVFDAKDEKLVEKLVAASGGSGFEVVLECSGVRVAHEMSIKALAACGIFVIVGCRDSFTLEALNFAVKERWITGSNLFTADDFDTVIKLMADKKIAGLEKYTSEVPLEDAQDAFLKVLSGKCDVIKFILKP